MKDSNGIQAWIRGLIDHQVKRNRDERSALDDEAEHRVAHKGHAMGEAGGRDAG